MTLLSRSEELVLLAIWKLKDLAYGVPIRDLLSEWTEHEWAIGTIYKPLKQLTLKALVIKTMTEPSAERGGRSKYIYSLTPKGEEALREIRKIQSAAWDSIEGELSI
jgi:PadR family transcriptional regulator, regulatory protein PadR